MPGAEGFERMDRMPVVPKGADVVEQADPTTNGLAVETDDKVTALLGRKLD